jgi:hypothetical protein
LQTETLFHTYSQFASVPNIPPKPTEDERQAETKLQEILEKVCSSIYDSCAGLTNAARSTHITTLPPPRLRSNSHSLRSKTKQPHPTSRNPPRAPPRAHTFKVAKPGCTEPRKPALKCQERH